MFVPTATGHRPAIYKHFDEKMRVRIGSQPLHEMPAVLGEVTNTDLVLNPSLNKAAQSTTVKFARLPLPAFWILKASVFALREATTKDIGLHVPHVQWPSHFALDRTGRSLCIGERPPDRDVRRQLALFVPNANTTNIVEHWDPSKHTQAQFERALKDFRQFAVASQVFYERELNCFWVIDRNEWWVGMDYWSMLPPTDVHFVVELDRNSNVSLRRRALPGKERKEMNSNNLGSVLTDSKARSP